MVTFSDVARLSPCEFWRGNAMKLLFGVPIVILILSTAAMAQEPGAAAGATAPSAYQQGAAAPPPAQFGNSQSPLLGGIPTGKATGGVIPLSLSEAMKRGLSYNLGAVLSAEQIRATSGARLVALSRLLPQLNAGASEVQQQVNLAAFGFQGFPGMKTIVGPFNVFNVRAYVTQTVLDLSALNRYRAENENLKAAQLSNTNVREVVVYVIANLYLQAVASNSRIEATRAQVKTAQALYDLAVDQKSAGVVPGIEVLRAQVELQAQQQRLIVAEDQYAKDKLALAQAIGLPLGQDFTLTDGMSYSPIPAMSLDEAVGRAYKNRTDLQSAEAGIRAAELDRKSAKAQRYPGIDFSADYGTIGQRPWENHGTFTVATTVRVPIFQGGRVKGTIFETEAALRQRQAELENLRARIYHDVQISFLDLKAASDRVQVAQSAIKLADEQVQQSHDRFRAGVTNNVEVVQAQEALATASENYIASLQAHSAAKLALARAIGVSDTAYEQFLRGQ
jgi:outer membrane protein TolC